MRTRLSLVVALVLAACGSKSSDKPEPGSGTGSAPVPVPTGTHLFVDNKDVAAVTAAQVASWPRLDSFLPETARRLGKWQSITVKNAKPQPSTLDKPFETHRDFIPALFPGPDGGISFGMFDPVELGKHGKPALQEDGVLEVRVALQADSGRGENDHQGGEAIDPQNIKLSIKTAKGEQILSGDKLLAIPRELMPGGSGDAKGWKLVALLDAEGVKTFEKLLLTDAGGLTLTIEKKDISDKAVPFVKLNRQGSLRFRIYKQQGEGWAPAENLKELVAIEVLK